MYYVYMFCIKHNMHIHTYIYTKQGNSDTFVSDMVQIIFQIHLVLTTVILLHIYQIFLSLFTVLNASKCGNHILPLFAPISWSVDFGGDFLSHVWCPRSAVLIYCLRSGFSFQLQPWFSVLCLYFNSPSQSSVYYTEAWEDYFVLSWAEK